MRLELIICWKFYFSAMGRMITGPWLFSRNAAEEQVIDARWANLSRGIVFSK